MITFYVLVSFLFPLGIGTYIVIRHGIEWGIILAIPLALFVIGLLKLFIWIEDKKL